MNVLYWNIQIQRALLSRPNSDRVLPKQHMNININYNILYIILSIVKEDRGKNKQYVYAIFNNSENLTKRFWNLPSTADYFLSKP